MALSSSLLFLGVLCLYGEETAAFKWSVSSHATNGSTIHACAGDTVTLDWTFTTDPAEHVVDHEWYFQAEGQSNTLIATIVAGNFLPVPSVADRVKHLPNAGITLTNLTVADSGVYSVHINFLLHGVMVTEKQSVILEVSSPPVAAEGRLKVILLPGQYVNKTDQWHAMLSCGRFSSYGQPPASVVWTLPSKQTAENTFVDKGSYLLAIPNPVASGQYTCQIKPSQSTTCLERDSPLHNEFSLVVDGVDARMSLLEGHLEALQVENKQMKEELEKNNCCDKQSPKASFFARGLRDDFPTLDTGDPVILRDVLTNEGHAYNATSGDFIAPINGTYAFHVTVAAKSSRTAHANIYVGDTYYCAATSTYSSHTELGNCNIMVHLEKGQRVWLRNSNENAQYNQDWNTFSGSLLHADAASC